jgi:hypothetical protein
MTEEAAAKNPTLGDMRPLAKALVSESRSLIAGGRTQTPVRAYMGKDGDISILNPDAKDLNQANAELLLKLSRQEKEGNIRAAALCDIVDKQIPGGAIVKFMQVHVERVIGKAFATAVPADESVLLAGVPGVDVPALPVFGGPTQSKIFPAQS